MTKLGEATFTPDGCTAIEKSLPQTGELDREEPHAIQQGETYQYMVEADQLESGFA